MLFRSRRPPRSTLFPYTTFFRSAIGLRRQRQVGNVEIRSIGNSEVEGAVTLCVKQALLGGSEGSYVSVNEAPKKGLSLAGSLGFMIYKTLTAGNVLAVLIINERNNKMKDRILLSGTKSRSYLGGISLIYLLFMFIGSAVYYLAAMVLGFDFGMRNSLGFLLVLLAANVLSTAIYLFVSTHTDYNGGSLATLLVASESPPWGRCLARRDRL